MDSIGVNIGYLFLSLLCLGGFLAAMAGGVYLAARMAFNMSAKMDYSELVMSFDVGEEGIIIPKSVFEDAEKVELRQTKTELILRPIVED